MGICLSDYIYMIVRSVQDIELHPLVSTKSWRNHGENGDAGRMVDDASRQKPPLLSKI